MKLQPSPGARGPGPADARPAPEIVVPFPSLMIKPVSSRCPLACRYCYYSEPPREGGDGAAMSDEVLEAGISGYLGLAPRAVLAWQGGEPLLAGRRHFERAVEIVRRGARPGAPVSLSVQTNGLLLDRAFCRFFRENGFLVGLSLDGPPETHDRWRIGRDGRGTFARVRAALDLLAEEGVEFNVLAVVTEEGARAPREIYRFLREAGARHLQFIPCYASRPGVAALSPAGYRDLLLDLLDAWREEGDPGVHVQMVDQALLCAFGHPPQTCVLQQACSALTLEAQGDLYPCDFFAEEGWRLGNVLESPFQALVESDRFIAFLKATARVPARCLECRFRSSCNGGCARHRFDAAGRFDGENPYCGALMEFFERVFAMVGQEGAAG